MGQSISFARERFEGKRWREKQIRKITDRAFDRIREDTGHDQLSFHDLYIAVLCVYNDINKLLPGRHNDPPPKEKLKAMMQEYDINLNGLLDREEFANFMKELTKDTVKNVGQNLLIGFIVAPVVALLLKRATEEMPHVRKAVQNVPNSIYASIIALAVVVVQKSIYNK